MIDPIIFICNAQNLKNKRRENEEENCCIHIVDS